MAALLAAIAVCLIAAPGASATQEAQIFNDVGGFDTIAVIPVQAEGKTWEQVLFCLHLSEAERQRLAAEGNTAAAWETPECIGGVLNPAGTSSAAEIPKLA